MLTLQLRAELQMLAMSAIPERGKREEEEEEEEGREREREIRVQCITVTDCHGYEHGIFVAAITH